LLKKIWWRLHSTTKTYQRLSLEYSNRLHRIEISKLYHERQAWKQTRIYNTT
jgi:hypothetical protein